MDREPECTPNEEVKGVVTEKETKMCIRCHHLKPIDVFEKKKRELNYRNICRNCRCNSARVRTVLRRKHIKRHGLPSGKCAICDKRNLVFDHCHSTNMFRGWICRACNSGIGKMGDTYRDVQIRADYLKCFEAVQVLFFMKGINTII